MKGAWNVPHHLSVYLPLKLVSALQQQASSRRNRGKPPQPYSLLGDIPIGGLSHISIKIYTRKSVNEGATAPIFLLMTKEPFLCSSDVLFNTVDSEMFAQT